MQIGQRLYEQPCEQQQQQHQQAQRDCGTHDVLQLGRLALEQVWENACVHFLREDTACSACKC